MPNFSCGHQPWMGISCVECRPDIYTKGGEISPHAYWDENHPCPPRPPCREDEGPGGVSENCSPTFVQR